MGRDISHSTFAFTFSALFSKVLISVGLIAGAGSLIGDVSVEETSSISAVETPMRRSKLKSMACYEVILSIFTPRVTAVVAIGSLIWATSEPVFVLSIIYLINILSLKLRERYPFSCWFCIH